MLGQVASHGCIYDTWFPFMSIVLCHYVALGILQTQRRLRHCQVTQWIKEQIYHTYHHTIDWEFGTAGPTSKPHVSQADTSIMSMSNTSAIIGNAFWGQEIQIIVLSDHNWYRNFSIESAFLKMYASILYKLVLLSLWISTLFQNF